MGNARYKAVIIGLTGIGAARPAEPEGLPVYGAMPKSHASGYHRCPDTDLVAVCDIQDKLLSDFKTQWSDVWPDVSAYKDYREMLDKEQPDIVSVVTGDHLHADLVVESAQRSSTKAIICEKPIATTLEDADRMIEATEKKGVLLSIEHSRRWHASFLEARELIRSGEIGNLKTIVCEMFSQRAMMFRNGTHAIDMICFFAESDPAWLTAELEEGFEDFTEYKGDGGRLVQHQNLWLVEQGPGDEQTAAHSPRQLVGPLFQLVLKLKQLQQLQPPLPGRRRRKVEKASVGRQVLHHVQVRVEAIRLGNHPQHRLDGPRLTADLLAIHPKLSLGNWGGAGNHLDGAGLARAVGAEDGEALARRNIEADPVDRRQVLIALG